VGLVALTYDQRKSVKVSMLVAMLVLVLFAVLLVAGRPIMYFGSDSLSVAYLVAVYLPIMAICLLAYRRMTRG
jgi:Na+-driven multidrug efflux pump